MERAGRLGVSRGPLLRGPDWRLRGRDGDAEAAHLLRERELPADGRPRGDAVAEVRRREDAAEGVEGGVDVRPEAWRRVQAPRLHVEHQVRQDEAPREKERDGAVRTGLDVGDEAAEGPHHARLEARLDGRQACDAGGGVGKHDAEDAEVRDDLPRVRAWRAERRHERRDGSDEAHWGEHTALRHVDLKCRGVAGDHHAEEGLVDGLRHPPGRVRVVRVGRRHLAVEGPAACRAARAVRPRLRKDAPQRARPLGRRLRRELRAHLTEGGPEQRLDLGVGRRGGERARAPRGLLVDKRHDHAEQGRHVWGALRAAPGVALDGVAVGLVARVGTANDHLLSTAEVRAGADLGGAQEMVVRGAYTRDQPNRHSVERYARGGSQGSPDMPALFGMVMALVDEEATRRARALSAAWPPRRQAP